MPAGIIKLLRTIIFILQGGLKELAESVFKTILIILAGILLLMMLYIMPTVIHERVPVTLTREQALWYYDAAQAATLKTQSPCDEGVYVDWQEVIAIDAVRLKQNFKKSSPERAEALAMNFIEEDGTCTN